MTVNSLPVLSLAFWFGDLRPRLLELAYLPLVLRFNERAGQEARRKQWYHWALKYPKVKKFKGTFSIVVANQSCCPSAREGTPSDRKGEGEESQSFGDLTSTC